MKRGHLMPVCVGAALVLAALGGGAFAAGARNAGACPDLLFYASFDKAGHKDLKTVTGVTGRHGKAGRYPNADYARGNPVPRVEQNLTIDEAGRFGQAVHLANGPRRFWDQSMLIFDAKRNVNPRRGAICLWFKPGKAFRRIGHKWRPHLFWLGQQSWPTYFTACLRVRPWHKRKGAAHFQAFDRDFRERTSLLEYMEEPLEIGRWVHMAFLWDEVHGLKVYRDGKPLATNWNRKRASWHFEAAIDALALGGLHTPCFDFPAARELSFDEVYVFDRPLTDAEVGALYARNEPPRRAESPRTDAARFRAHRIEELGWQDRANIPTVRRGAGKAFRVEDVFIRKALDVRRNLRAPLDGKRMTAWPVDGHGYTMAGKELHLDLGREREVNWVRFVGSIAGPLLRDGREVARLSHPRRTPGRVQRVALPPRPGRVWTVRREKGRITDCALFRLTPNGGEPRTEGRVELALSADAPGKLPEDVETFLLSYFLKEDRPVVAARSDAQPGEFPVRALRYWHVLLPAFERDEAVAGLTLDLALKGFPEKTLFGVFMIDPVTRLRKTFEFEFFAVGRAEERLKVALDTQDFMLRRGRQVLLTVVTDADGALRCGPGASRAILHTTTKEKALEEYYTDQIMVAKNVAANNTENSPGKKYSVAPYSMYRGLAEGMDLIADLHHYAPTPDLDAFMDFVTRRRHRYQWTAAPGYFMPPPYAPKFEDPSAPAWANWLRLAHTQYRRVVDYYLDRRQVENGEVGGCVNDDTCFIKSWVDLAMMGDDDGRIRRGYRRLADHTWRHTMRNGLSARGTDHGHSYENGNNIQGKLCLLFYGEPEAVERQMVTSRRYHGYLMAKNPRGQTLFRSWAFGDNGVNTKGRYGYDILQCSILESGLDLCWYNNNPKNDRLFKDWVDTWFAVANWKDSMRPWRKPLRWETGRPDPPLRSVSSAGLIDVCYRIARRSRDARYIRPFHPKRRLNGPTMYLNYRDLIEEIGTAEDVRRWDAAFPDRWRAKEDGAYALDLKLSGSTGAPPPPTKGSAEVLAEWRVCKDKSLIPLILKPVCRTWDLAYPGHTWLEMPTDRIGLPTPALSELMLGGQAGGRGNLYFYIAASWEGAGTDVARLVVEDRTDRLKVMLYNFSDAPKDVALRVWRLRHGTYRVRGGRESGRPNEIGRTDFQRTERLFRSAPVRFRLPPKAPYVVECALSRAMDPIADRCDLAVGPGDVVYDAKTDTLTVTVHNLGSRAAPASEVRVLDGEGRTLGRAALPPIEGTADLFPKTVKRALKGLNAPAAGKLRVVVDPDDSVPEITDENNAREIVLERR